MDKLNKKLDINVRQVIGRRKFEEKIVKQKRTGKEAQRTKAAALKKIHTP